MYQHTLIKKLKEFRHKSLQQKYSEKLQCGLCTVTSSQRNDISQWTIQYLTGDYGQHQQGQVTWIVSTWIWHNKNATLPLWSFL